jgi:hypothetical protein
MAKIVQYVAPTEALTESTRGTQAFEQAGRRLGPLYNESAVFEREQGALTAQGIKQLAWPFDIAKLLATEDVGGRVKVDTRSLNQDPGRGGGSPDLSSVGQMSRGAGALGNALRDGGYAAARKTAEPIVQDDKGNWVTASSAAKAAQQEANAAALDQQNQLNADVSTRDYWTKYNGGSTSQTDQSGVSDQPPAVTGDYGGGGPAMYPTYGGSSASNEPEPASTGLFSGLSNWTQSDTSAPAEGTADYGL